MLLDRASLVVILFVTSFYGRQVEMLMNLLWLVWKKKREGELEVADERGDSKTYPAGVPFPILKSDMCVAQLVPTILVFSTR